MKALIAGATGLVGSHLLRMLIDDPDYKQVWVLTRSSVNTGHKKIREIIADFQHLADSLTEVDADHVFCCLGTTMKKAGSRQAFRKVDLEYPREIAQIMFSKKTEKFLLVSAIGANKNSFFFYNRVKGEVEDAISRLGFPGLFIFRPSLLLGDRKEERIGEDMAKKIYHYIDWTFFGPFKKYKGIPAETVAASMLKMAKSDLVGTVLLESDQIMEA